MRGFCGWILSDAARGTPTDAVAGMKLGEASSVESRTDEWAIRISSDRPGSLDSYVGQGDFAIVAGAPRTFDPAFSSLIDRYGLAHACLIRYRDNGVSFLADLEGAFSLALTLEDSSKSLLARDRVGVNSMYYAISKEGLGFSTNLNCLRGSSILDAKISLQSVYDYLYFHVIPSPNTIYEDVYCLEPGCFLELVDNGRNRVGQYWQISYSNERAKIDERRLASEFMDLLRSCVERESDSDQELGCFLSGGTDSSTLVGILGDVSNKPVRTYSIGFDQEGFDEIEYARIAAKHFGAQYHEYYVTPDDIVDLIPKVSQVYGQPFGNSSVVPTYFCARMAREDGVTRLLGGDGGDELFGGNTRYGAQVLFSYYQLIPPAMRKYVIEPVVDNLPWGNNVVPIRKIQRYVEQAKIRMPDRMHTYSYLDLLGRDVVLSPGFVEALDGDRSLDALRDVYEGIQARHIINKMAGLDLKITLADNDLPKVSGMCELAGVSVGYPFLQPDMVDFSARLPADLKVRGRRLRYFFKKALGGYLPREIIEKPKHGFGLPFGDWLVSHADLKAVAFDSLASLKSREIIRAEFIDDLRERLLFEHPNYYGGFIWILMILEQFFLADSGPVTPGNE